MSTPSITIGAREFIALVDAVIPFAGTDRGLPVLNAVHIESRGTHLVAQATDRYRLGVKRLAAEEGVWPEFSVLLSLATLRSIKSMFKPMRGMDSGLKLTVEGDALTVEADGALMDMLSARASYFAEVGEFPKVSKLLAQAIDRQSESGDFRVNPRFLDALPGLNSNSLWMRAGKDNPIFFTDGEDFIGIIMPRPQRGNEMPSMDDWKALLDAPPLVAEKPAKRTRKAVA